jgi:hypothetical protein
MKRTAPLKRSGFNRTPPTRERAEVRPSSMPAAKCRMFDGKARLDVAVPVPKDIKAKPGKGKPTAEEARWMVAIRSLGCIVCHMQGKPGVPAAVHHLIRGGQRIGHLYTIPLCDPGHHQNGGPGVSSRHPWKARFEAAYGTEQSLLARCRTLVGWTESEPAAPQAPTEGT